MGMSGEAHPVKGESHSSRCCQPLMMMDLPTGLKLCGGAFIYIHLYTDHTDVKGPINVKALYPLPILRNNLISTFEAPVCPFQISFLSTPQEITISSLSSSYLWFLQSGFLSLYSRWAHPSGSPGDLSLCPGIGLRMNLWAEPSQNCVGVRKEC